MDIVLSVDSWIIQDGNQCDFRVGDICDFALEFVPLGIEPHGKGKNFSRLDHATYSINAEVIYVDNDSWVIDCGIKAYHELEPPRGVNVGDSVSGTISLGVDPGFYSMGFRFKAEFPGLSYKWEVEKIEMGSIPLLHAQPENLRNDTEQETLVEIPQTNAWEDMDGKALYFLHCKQLED